MEKNSRNSRNFQVDPSLGRVPSPLFLLPSHFLLVCFLNKKSNEFAISLEGIRVGVISHTMYQWESSSLSREKGKRALDDSLNLFMCCCLIFREREWEIDRGAVFNPHSLHHFWYMIWLLALVGQFILFLVRWLESRGLSFLVEKKIEKVESLGRKSGESGEPPSKSL